MKVKINLRGVVGFDITAQSIIDQIKAAGDSDIELRIESPGGSVYEGLPIFNAIKAHTGTVTAVLDGQVASIATYICSACDEVQATSNAVFMVHGPSVGAHGSEDDMTAAIEQLTIARDNMVKAYMEKTGKSEDDIRALLQRDTYMSAQEAKEYGFIDTIVDAATLTNYAQSNASLTGFNSSVPTQRQPTESQSMPLNAQITTAIQAENTRQSDIRAMFSQHTLDDNNALLTSCLNDASCTPEIAGTRLLKSLGQQNSGVQAPSARLTNGNHVIESLTNTLEHRCGLAALESDNGLGTYSLMDMARELCALKGYRNGNHSELVARAFNSGDLAKIIGTTMDKVVRDQAKLETPLWLRFCSTTNLANFHQKDIVTLNDMPDLLPVSEDGEYKKAILKGGKESLKAATFGREVDVTRQTIINDDMDVINKIPRKLVQAAFRGVSKKVFKLIVSGAKMSDNKNLYIAENTLTGNNLADLVLKAAIAIAKAKGTEGDPLDLKGEFLLSGHTLGPQLNPIIKTPGNAEKYNPAFGKFKEVIETGYLDDFAGFIGLTQKDFETIIIGFLNGQQEPWLEHLTGDYASNGLKMRITYDYDVGVADRRGIVKATVTGSN